MVCNDTESRWEGGAHRKRCLPKAQFWTVGPGFARWPLDGQHPNGSTSSCCTIGSFEDHTFDGLKLERWFLKTAYMLWHSGNFGSGGTALQGAPPRIWAALLTGTVSFPPTWGLYIPTGYGPFMTVDRQFSAMPLTGSDGSGIKAVHFKIAKVQFYLMLADPDYQAFWGVRRPRQLDLGNDLACHRLRLTWPEGAQGGAVTLQRVGDRALPVKWMREDRDS